MEIWNSISESISNNISGVMTVESATENLNKVRKQCQHFKEMRDFALSEMICFSKHDKYSLVMAYGRVYMRAEMLLSKYEMLTAQLMLMSMKLGDAAMQESFKCITVTKQEPQEDESKVAEFVSEKMKSAGFVVDHDEKSVYGKEKEVAQ